MKKVQTEIELTLVLCKYNNNEMLHWFISSSAVYQGNVLHCMKMVPLILCAKMAEQLVNEKYVKYVKYECYELISVTASNS